PVAGVFAVPAHGHLDQPAVARAMQVAPRMIAGADHVVRAHLEDVGLAAVKPGLMAPLKPLAAALGHRVRTAGGAVVEPIAPRVVLDGVRRRRTIERPYHSGLPVGLRDLGVATRAYGACDVRRLRRARRADGSRTSSQAEREHKWGGPPARPP